MARGVAWSGTRVSGGGEDSVVRLVDDGVAILDDTPDAGTRRAGAFGWGRGRHDAVSEMEDMESRTEDELE